MVSPKSESARAVQAAKRKAGDKFGVDYEKTWAAHQQEKVKHSDDALIDPDDDAVQFDLQVPGCECHATLASSALLQ